MGNEMKIPALDDIRSAADFLKGKINLTRLDHSRIFSERFRSEIWFKPENLQKTGSFKIRGAIIKLNSLSAEERKRGIIAVSAGNHAQGVALAAKILGIDVKIVMPKNTTPTKINAVEEYGARIVLSGNDYAEAREEAVKIMNSEGRSFIEGFNDPFIVAGQGTIGLEIMEEMPDTEQIVVPVGGGGLISGIAIAAKSMNRKVKIIGVQSEHYSSFMKSFYSGKVTDSTYGTTIADGIAIRIPGDLNLEIAKRYVDQVVTVDEESIALAIYSLLDRNKYLVEPAGAAGFGALLSGSIDVEGKKTVFVLSGGNINLLLLSKIIYKSMEKESSLVRISFKIPDRPGTLYRIAQVISNVGGNIYHAEVDNLEENTPVGYQSVSFTVNLRNASHAEILSSELKKLGWVFTMVHGSQTMEKS
ncbi:MAG: threonine ammonia-lyase [Candidatus Thermoplasmatota archaeon]|nr:threonine ammonia-lyase [Candidatus Thermoplasmatota archaeon]MCL5665653.1 threonine ammonia-lyase [Candidatus Thermoplasmatota archaeon]